MFHDTTMDPATGLPIYTDTSATTGSTPAASSSDWTTYIPQLVSQGLQAFTQQQLLQYNLDQIKAGKAPLTAAQMSSLMSSSAPTVNVGVSADVQNLLLYGMLGIGGIVIVSSVMKSLRR